jgi:hypothetical protein
VIVEAQLEGRFAEGHTVAKIALPYSEVRLELRASADRIEGLVLGPGGGPIEGAKISATSSERGLKVVRTTASGPGGEYVLTGLVPGAYRLEASAEEHQTARREVTVAGVAKADLSLEAACQPTLQIGPGTPARPVRVILRRDDRVLAELAGLTGSPIAIKGQGGTVAIHARTVGSPVRTATISVDLCQSPTIELSLGDKKGTGDLEVSVVDAEGRSVPKAYVWRAGSGYVKTGADGKVRFDGLLPGEYMVGARDARPERVEVKAGELTKVELRVDRGAGSVRGRVLSKGTGIEGARVLAACADSGRTPGLEGAAVVARSDANGMFEFTPDDGSVCRVRAEHPSQGRSRAVTLRAGGEEGVLELISGASIAGRVVGKAGDKVVPCSVSLASLAGASEVEGRTAYVSAEDGSFKFDDVSPGRIALAVVGGSGRGRLELELSPGEQKQGVELEVFKRGRVIGQVVDADRATLANVAVTIRAGNRDLAKSTTGPDGRFDLEVEAGEPLRAYASKPGYYVKGTLPFDLVPGPPTDLGAIVLERKGPPEEKEGGLGMMFATEDNGIRILNFTEDSPAREAGVMKGDVVTAIDHQPFAREAMFNWLVHLRGRVGTTVIIEIERGTSAPFNVSIVRRAIGLPPMPDDADL